MTRRRTSPLSRRQLFLNAGALAALARIGWHPGLTRAASTARERKFLFFFASGAWDTTTVLDPHWGSDGVDMDPEAEPAEANGISFAGGPELPSAEAFFQRWGNRAAVVNGMDAHTVGHDSGRQMTLTGTSASSYADWPTLLAAHAQGEYPLPHLVMSGPSFPGTEGAAVVRAGGGTLIELLDASIVGQGSPAAPRLADPADRMVDAVVYERMSAFFDQRAPLGGRASREAEALLGSLERTMELEGRRFEAGLSDLGRDLADQAIKAVEMMRLGLSRCAMVGIPGGWDSHGDNTVQSPQQDALFEALDALFTHMASTPGLVTPWLVDEVVVVCLSEFGRTPKLNGGGGKDHWPYLSALVAGSGVNGGRSLGATDDGLVGLPVDFATGLPSDTGEVLGTENLGTALLRLGGLDPESVLPGIQPLEALLA